MTFKTDIHKALDPDPRMSFPTLICRSRNILDDSQRVLDETPNGQDVTGSKEFSDLKDLIYFNQLGI